MHDGRCFLNDSNRIGRVKKSNHGVYIIKMIIFIIIIMRTVIRYRFEAVQMLLDFWSTYRLDVQCAVSTARTRYSLYTLFYRRPLNSIHYSVPNNKAAAVYSFYNSEV